MSTYSKITKHPQTGMYELAVWHDDYYGPHLYGVEFASDKKVYPTDLVERKQIYDFWKDDVLAAFRQILSHHGFYDEFSELNFLNQIEAEYKARWKRDPITGEGATEKSAIVKRKKA